MCTKPHLRQIQVTFSSFSKTLPSSMFFLSARYRSSWCASTLAMLRKRLATSGKPSLSATSANAGYRSVHSSFSPSAAASRFSAVVPFRLPAG